jgi:hypothetical protein
MGPRMLSRWCRERFDESPAELVRRLRLDEARRLLEETVLPLKDITARTGFGDASTLWRAFTQRHAGRLPTPLPDLGSGSAHGVRRNLTGVCRGPFINLRGRLHLGWAPPSWSQMLGKHLQASAAKKCFLNHQLEFSDVFWPSVSFEQAHHGWAQRGRQPATLLAGASDEVLRQPGDL